MKLAHISLAVADQQRSRTFYETFFGVFCDGKLDAESLPDEVYSGSSSTY